MLKRQVLTAALLGIALTAVWIPTPGAQVQTSSPMPIPATLGVASDIMATDTNIRLLREVDSQITAWEREGSLVRYSRVLDPMAPRISVERYQQYHNGLKVWGGDVVRESENGVPLAVFGTLARDIALDTNSTLPISAGATMLRALGGTGSLLLTEPELVVLPLPGGTHVLTYTGIVATNNDIIRAFADARTGQEVWRYSDVHQQSVGTGTGVLNDRKKLSVLLNGGRYRTYDTHRIPEIQTFDLAGDLNRAKLIANGRQTLEFADIAADADNVWTDPAVVDAHAHIAWTYDYLFKRFGRNGLDGRNGPINILVNPVTQDGALRLSQSDFTQWATNAFWCGWCQDGQGVVVFGSGIPSGYYSNFDGKSWNQTAGALDVAAHELTHGLIDNTSRLIYYNESGALNEAFADMMGKGVEFFFRASGTAPGQADYVLGKDVIRGVVAGRPNGIRSMSNPATHGHPDHYSRRHLQHGIDNAGVHINSAIPNQVFYLAIEGGTNRTSGRSVQGVGSVNRDQIERVFYRAVTTLLPSSATFLMARVATIQSARDLYGSGSSVERALADAWSALGVPDMASVLQVNLSLSRGGIDVREIIYNATGTAEVNLTWPNTDSNDLDVYVTRAGCPATRSSCIVAASTGPFSGAPSLITTESASWSVRGGERYWITAYNYSGGSTTAQLQTWVNSGL